MVQSQQLEPMTIGVISDLHANALATAAVIADGQGAGIDAWLVLGDNVAMGPDPIGVLDILDELRLLGVVAGNTERYVLTGDRPEPSLEAVAADPSLLPQLVEVAATFAWTKGALSAAGRLEVLRGYAPHRRYRLADGTRLLAVHASLAADDGPGIQPDTGDDVMLRLFAGVEADLVVGGHTHRVTDRLLDGVRYVNPGSVSNPHGDNKAARYAVITSTSSHTDVAFRTVDYDVDAVRNQIRTSGIPGSGFLLDQYFS